MAFKFSQKSLSKLEGVHPTLAKIFKEAITDCPYDITLTWGLRTAAQQRALYNQGRNGNKGPIVTKIDGYRVKSNHQAKSDGYGHAVDFAIYDPNVEGHIDWESIDKYRAVARHIQAVGKKYGVNLQWGGDWNTFKDTPHIEMP